MNYRKIATITLGCKTNFVESDAVFSSLEASGKKDGIIFESTDVENDPDYIVINTCSVTAMSDKKSRQIIRRTRRKNPNSFIGVMGCYSQLKSEIVESLDCADFICGTNNRNSLINAILEHAGSHSPVVREPGIQIIDIMADSNYEDIPISSSGEKTRAFIKIQEGCEQYCSFCIIPFARGKLKSRDPKSILAEISLLVKKGYSEFVLTGTHIASYIFDQKTLIDLVELINKVDGLKRLRLGSLEPKIITKDFVKRAGACNSLCEHFHLSLQSGSNKILKKMNRRYTAEDYLDAVKLLNEGFDRPAITTDIIVGFPYETEEDFNDSLSIAKNAGFAQIHVFPYSDRNGSAASKFPHKVDEQTKNERAKTLSSLAQSLSNDYQAQFDLDKLEILPEKTENNMLCGYSRNYIYICRPLK